MFACIPNSSWWGAGAGAVPQARREPEHADFSAPGDKKRPSWLYESPGADIVGFRRLE
jgi:hypothetical protein